MNFATADLYDSHSDKVQVALPLFRDYGGRKSFHGPISTVSVFEDNALVRAALEEKGEGRVLVIDGGASLRCALIGDNLARIARDNGWQGIIVSGCIRDAAVIAGIDIGVKALGATPRKSGKRGEGSRDVEVQFAGVTFIPGHFLYADEDGILTAGNRLS